MEGGGVFNYNPRLKARQDDEWIRRGGVAVYRGYLNSDDDLPAAAPFEGKQHDTDFDAILDRATPNRLGSDS